MERGGQSKTETCSATESGQQGDQYVNYQHSVFRDAPSAYHVTNCDKLSLAAVAAVPGVARPV